MHILIVTHFYPPLNAIASLRPRSFARYFAEQGHEVTVVTTQKSVVDGNLDLEPFDHPGIKVVELPYKPLFFWQKETVTAPVPTPAPKQSSNGGLKAKAVNMLKSVLHSMGYLIDRQRFWIKPAVTEISELMHRHKVDVIVSTFAPPAVHIVASKIVAKFPSVTWIADYRDLWSQNHLMPSRGIFKVWERNMEKKAISRASHLTTVSGPLAVELEELTKHSIPVSVVYNGFDSEVTLPPKRPEISIGHRPLRIVYTGIIYKNRRDPAPLFKALKELKEEGIIKSGEVQVDFYGSANANLGEIITQCDASEWVNIKGYISYSEALKVQQAADYLLFLESNSRDARGVLTGKLFEYLIAGKPVLGIGIDETCASGQVIKATNTGAVLGTDVALIKEHFRSLFVDHTDKTYDPDWEKIKEYSRNRQAQKMLDIIEGKTK